MEDIRKKLRKDLENTDIDEDSDIPISEKRAKDKKVREI